MKAQKRIFLIPLFFLMALGLEAAPVTIKLASIAPEHSPWGEALEKLAAEWSRISNGEVQLKIYHNGVAGTEQDILSKMRMNQLQGGIITSGGLSALSPEVLCLSIPFLIRDDAELDTALKATAPMMEERISKKGFTVLAWSKVGWLNFFTKKPIHTPTDLKNLKLAGGIDNETLVNAFKQLGFQVLPVPTNEVITSLNSGMIEAFYSSPLGAAGYQWFAKAPNMLDLRVSPFVGVIIVNSNTWKKVPEKYRGLLISRTREMIVSLDSQINNLEKNAMDVMLKNGLKVITPSKAEVGVWRSEMQASTGKTLGTVFPIDMYNAILKALGRDGAR